MVSKTRGHRLRPHDVTGRLEIDGHISQNPFIDSLRSLGARNPTTGARDTIHRAICLHLQACTGSWFKAPIEHH